MNRRKRCRKAALIFAAGLAAALAVSAGLGFALVSASLPRHGGRATVPGLAAPVRVELDGLGIPRLHARSLEDAYRAEGFAHAQARFFEMDLARRSAAGELAALVGRAALPLDEKSRPYGFRGRARAVLAALPARERGWLEAYAQGVNAGLGDLRGRPPAYWALGARPEPWKPEDSLLVAYAFYTMLSDNENYEEPQGVMKATLPESVYRFLTPTTSRFDRPLAGLAAGDATGGYRALPIPPAEDLRAARAPMSSPSPSASPSPAPAPPVPPAPAPIVEPPLTGPASNEWAVAASRSATGAAMVANDPHLTLRLPNSFYRTELYWHGHAARGLGIPGLPGIIVGATDRLAWGVTVSYVDQADWVVVETAPDAPGRYLVPGGSEAFRIDHERIAVRGGPPVTIAVKTTRWGPVLARDWRGRPLALHAAWLEPDGLDLEMLGLLETPNAAAGVELVDRWHGPSLNWVFADTGGHIAWTVNGPIPKRRGLDGSVPESWAAGDRGWQGRLEPPRLEDPADGVLFTANNRTLAEPDADSLTHMWMRPLRAKRIADMLAEHPRLDARTSLAMQLDTRAEGYDFVRDIALEVLAPDDPDPVLRRVRAHVAAWNGRADADQPGFRLLQVFYRALLERVLSPLLARPRAADPAFVYRWPLADEPLRRLLEARPAALLPETFATWQAYLRNVLVEAVHGLERDPQGNGPDAPWGAVNRLEVSHPLARVPLLGRWLRLPSVPLSGSMVSVRVLAPDFGAVFRMDVAPGSPEAGLLEMAGGQSGHPLSAHFEDQERAWEHGTPAPFLAGPIEASFELEPQPP